jgi:hypothetical protein
MDDIIKEIKKGLKKSDRLIRDCEKLLFECKELFMENKELEKKRIECDIRRQEQKKIDTMCDDLYQEELKNNGQSICN